ncbi:MAG: putative translation initiation inhibitor, yjgF family [Rubritepida sp.]|nr:putative translation initiation inhibitor, yjgF family [Rubritepida sp.]
MSKIEARLAELGLTLPPASAPIANYVPFTITGKVVYISGQVPRNKAGAIWPVGQLGAGVSVEEGQAAAQLCFLSIIAHAKAAAGGDLDKIARVLRLTGYVNSATGFGEQPAVINGASDCAVAVFGEAGRHARSAVGVAALPGGAAVEVEAILELV